MKQLKWLIIPIMFFTLCGFSMKDNGVTNYLRGPLDIVANAVVQALKMTVKELNTSINALAMTYNHVTFAPTPATPITKEVK